MVTTATRAPWRQVLIIGLCLMMNAIDGFDILSISFAAPGIAAEWGINKAALGVVLAMELAGMSLGSFALGHLADRIGRRPAVLLCLALMAAGMASTALAPNVITLAVLRIVTGIGIGGLLSATSALVADLASDRWRSTAIAIMATGYPLGGAVGGGLAIHLLQSGNWRDLFLSGGIASFVMLVLALALLPKAPPSPPRFTTRCTDEPQPAGLAALFAPGLRATTLLLAAAYFSHVLTFYFVLKWVPKAVADMGFSAAQAGQVLMLVSYGGLAGSLVFSIASAALRLRPLLIAGTLASGVAVVALGQAPHTLSALGLAGFAAGLAANGVLVLFYAAAVSAFPESLRGGGTGLMLSLGRGGSAFGPILAGILFEAGHGFSLVSAVIALGSFISAALIAAWMRATQG